LQTYIYYLKNNYNLQNFKTKQGPLRS